MKGTSEGLGATEVRGPGPPQGSPLLSGLSHPLGLSLSSILPRCPYFHLQKTPTHPLKPFLGVGCSLAS